VNSRKWSRIFAHLLTSTSVLKASYFLSRTFSEYANVSVYKWDEEELGSIRTISRSPRSRSRRSLAASVAAKRSGRVIYSASSSMLAISDSRGLLLVRLFVERCLQVKSRKSLSRSFLHVRRKCLTGYARRYRCSVSYCPNKQR
jgi:hypothetical protein